MDDPGGAGPLLVLVMSLVLALAPVAAHRFTLRRNICRPAGRHNDYGRHQRRPGQQQPDKDLWLHCRHLRGGDGRLHPAPRCWKLRRPQSDRPIAIRFNLANGDPNQDLEVSGTWTLPVAQALPVLKTDTIVNKNGQVTIDGDPAGRAHKWAKDHHRHQ